MKTDSGVIFIGVLFLAISETYRSTLRKKLAPFNSMIDFFFVYDFMNMKKILFLDDNTDLCKTMVKFFNEVGYEDIICMNSFEEISKLTAAQINFDVIFLDVNLGINLPTGIDAYNYLVDKGYSGKVIFFTGHAQAYPILQKMAKLPNVKILSKPADISAIESVLND